MATGQGYQEHQWKVVQGHLLGNPSHRVSRRRILDTLSVELYHHPTLSSPGYKEFSNNFLKCCKNIQKSIFQASLPLLRLKRTFEAMESGEHRKLKLVSCMWLTPVQFLTWLGTFLSRDRNRSDAPPLVAKSQPHPSEKKNI